MAGKSTFMKSFGITVFLAHVGFPVPQRKWNFRFKNGMFTTINLPDNLSMGYSHFYAEVLRVKKVAQQVRQTQHLIVVFDELFPRYERERCLRCDGCSDGGFCRNPELYVYHFDSYYRSGRGTERKV